jgi:hypothetical protein
MQGKSVKIESKYKTVGEEIGSGNEGTVYEIEGGKSNVIKIFNESDRHDKEEKIRAMIKNDCRPQDPNTKSLIWPQSIVTKNGKFLGYKMQRVDNNNWSTALVEAKLMANKSLEKRIQPAFDLAKMVDEIHKKGHALGDFNHQNILVNKDNISGTDRNTICLLDCDAFHIKSGNDTYEGESFKVRYSPPEKRPSKFKEVRKADRFCLSVHIFQFLMGAHHPYAATGKKATGGDWDTKIQENKFPYENNGYEPPEEELKRRYNQLPQNLREDFAKIFSKSSKIGWGRVGITDWVDSLGKHLPDYDPNDHGQKSTGGNGDSPGDDDTEIEEAAEDIIRNYGNKDHTSNSDGDSVSSDDNETGHSEDGEDSGTDIERTAEDVMSSWGNTNGTSNSEGDSVSSDDNKTGDSEDGEDSGTDIEEKVKNIKDKWKN